LCCGGRRLSICGLRGLEELADDDEIAELEIIAEELALPGEEVPISNDIFAAPTSDMTTAVSATPDEDAQSHFDLGIAYKEMGMFAEAINEFASAARDPSRLLDCLILKGQCLVQWVSSSPLKRLSRRR